MAEVLSLLPGFIMAAICYCIALRNWKSGEKSRE